MVLLEVSGENCLNCVKEFTYVACCMSFVTTNLTFAVFICAHNNIGAIPCEVLMRTDVLDDLNGHG